MADDWKRHAVPLRPFPATAGACDAPLDEMTRVAAATGRCPVCGGTTVPAERMHNGWSMHRPTCSLVALGEWRMDLLLAGLGWAVTA